jgi:hypothetical protein
MLLERPRLPVASVKMFDAVLAAVALPATFIVGLVIVAAVMRARDVRRRDPVRRFSRQQPSE